MEHIISYSVAATGRGRFLN